MPGILQEQLFKNQLSSQDYRDAMANAEFFYDVTPMEIQTMTDVMVRFDMAKMTKPPKADEWVKTGLLTRAKKELGVK